MFPWLYIFLWVRKNYIHSSKNFSNKKSMYVSKRLHYACRPVATSPSFLPLLLLSVTISSTHPLLENCETLTSFRSLKALYIPCRLLAIVFSFLIFWRRYIDPYASDILHISNVLCVSFDSWLVFCFNFCFYRNKE